MPRLGNKQQHQIWIRDHLDYPHKEWCLIWPFPTTNKGYGTFMRDGKKHYVHRVMCEAMNGPPPTPRHQAAHSCNRGHEGCVNPHHMSWKTRSENMRHSSEMLGPHKLQPEQAREIRTLKGVEPTHVTAQRFGVRQCTIEHIQQGRTWTNLSETSGLQK